MDALGTDFDALLTRGALCALVGTACWALVVVASVAVEARTHGRISVAGRAGCPAALRLWLLGLFVAVSAGVTPAHASDTGSGPVDRETGTSIGMTLDGLRLPDRTAGAAPAHHRSGRADQVVVVVPGDSLWRIVRSRLPADRPDDAVAAVVAAVHAANRQVIGPDPDLILPGQRLAVGTLTDFPARSTLSEER